MRTKHLLSIGLLLTAIPAVVHAVQTKTWDLRSGDIPMPIVQGLTTVEKTAGGLHIKTSTDGFVVWQKPVIPPLDVVTLRMRSAFPIEGAFMWQPKGDDTGSFHQLYFTAGKTDELENVDVIPLEYAGSVESAQVLGLGFPAGTDTVIESVAWRHWGMGEKFAEAVRSFWTFDGMMQYSINFLWGPLLTFTPVTRATMFESLPPGGVSAMRAVYVVLLLAAAAAGILAFSGKKKAAVLTVIVTVASVWLLLDLRMGIETLSYATNDMRTFVMPHDGVRTFRGLGALEDTTDMVAFALKDAWENDHVKDIVVLEPAGNAYVAKLRLDLYPMPVTTYSDALKSTRPRAWLILQRPDITVKDGTVTDAKGISLSTKGSVIADFDIDSYLFLEE